MIGTTNAAAGRNQTVPWWAVFLEGILSAGFGILILYYPSKTFVAFLAALGWFWILEGFLGLIGLVAGLPVGSKWRIGLMWGLLSVMAGMFVLNQSLIDVYLTRKLIVYIVALMVIIAGITSVATANRRSETRRSKWGIIILPLLFIILGVVLLFTPYISFYIIMMLTGMICLTFGLLMIVYSAMMHSGLARGLND
jgi:membrane protein HdeD